MEHLRSPHAGELRAARAWATLNGYTFSWQDDPTDALDVKCTMWDDEGREVGEWIGGTAGTMTAADRLEIESTMSLEHMQEARVIPERGER